MKLKFIELVGFRGFKDRARFDFPTGFAVLTGHNGAGKSSVLDAFEFALTGSISKYSVTEAKGGGLDQHLWWVGDGAPVAQYVSVGFVDAEGKEVVVTRTNERGLAEPIETIADRLCEMGSLTRAWPATLAQTTLIRDETLAALSLDLPEQARFAAVRAAIGGLTGPDHGVRASSILRSAASAKTDQEKKVNEAQAELGRALTNLTEARSASQRQADVVEAEKRIESLEPEIADMPGDRVATLRGRLADRKRSMLVMQEVASQIGRLLNERDGLRSEEGQAVLAHARAELLAARAGANEAIEALRQAEAVEAAERETDAFAAHLRALLDHGESLGLQEGHCPLCDAARRPEDFASAIAAARTKLRERGLRSAAAELERERAGAQVASRQAGLLAAETRLAALEAREASLALELERAWTVFGQASAFARPDDLPSVNAQVERRQEEAIQLERALLLLEASSAHDRVLTLETRVNQLGVRRDEEATRLSEAERAVEDARQIDVAAKTVANDVLSEQFDTVMPLLKELYRRLRPHTDWREIETDFGGRVRATLNFTVGEKHNPQFLFSSGQRRAAGIAFLLAIHLSRPWCRLRTLLLDDPVQHIDDYRALNLVEVLSAVRREGRQVIVAVEDAALADVLCRRLRSTEAEGGRRFDLGTAKNGSALIVGEQDIHPLPREILVREVAS